jgi:succinyl-diaminopimelate desuccinylase
MNEIELTQELVKINSENPPGNEKEIAKFIYDYLVDSKIPAELIKIEGNRFDVVGVLGKGEGVMLNGHLDTVPAGDLKNWKYNPFSGKIVNGKLYGRGASDMKGGVAAMLVAVKNLARENFKRKLLLTFVADEEVALKGSEYLIKNRKNYFNGIKSGVTGECTNLKVRIAQKGITQVKLKFRGISAHGSKPELGDNAIYKAMDFIQELRKLIIRLRNKRDSLLGSGTINVGRISGGIKVNMIPDYCEIEVDRRLIPGETPEIAIAQMKRVLKVLKLKAEIEFLNEPRLPMKLPKESEIIKIIRDTTRTSLVGESGYTEAELFYREAGFPCFSFGPGISEAAHTTNEYIPIKNLKIATSVYEEIIKKVCL